MTEYNEGGLIHRGEDMPMVWLSPDECLFSIVDGSPVCKRASHRDRECQGSK